MPTTPPPPGYPATLPLDCDKDKRTAYATTSTAICPLQIPRKRETLPSDTQFATNPPHNAPLPLGHEVITDPRWTASRR